MRGLECGGAPLARPGWCAGVMLVLVMSAGACTNVPPLVPNARPPERIDALRVDARAITAPKCGFCHIASLDSAIPEALAVFDYDQPAWTARMTAEQLNDFMKQITSSLDERTAPVVRELLEAELAARPPGG